MIIKVSVFFIAVFRLAYATIEKKEDRLAKNDEYLLVSKRIKKREY
jgi:hypothetical protein